MRKIEYKLDIGYCGCGDEGETKTTDDMTDEQIDHMVNDMAHEWASQWEGDIRLCWDEDMTEEEYDEATQSFYEGVSGSWTEIDND